jgi:hypothetical protein
MEVKGCFEGEGTDRNILVSHPHTHTYTHSHTCIRMGNKDKIPSIKSEPFLFFRMEI